MNEHTSLRYLVDSKRGAIWVSVDDAPWSVESTVADDPKKYFNTLKGIFYMREYPKSAIKLFNNYKDNEEYNGENFSRN
tara:strand:+ start:554 stop:790 length:237 start_codon:yes stop_codon:yes gene_type:complete